MWSLTISSEVRFIRREKTFAFKIRLSWRELSLNPCIAYNRYKISLYVRLQWNYISISSSLVKFRPSIAPAKDEVGNDTVHYSKGNEWNSTHQPSCRHIRYL